MEHLKVERREVKYRVSLLQFRRLEERLSQALARDSYAREDGGYSIRSLYLDTIYESDYYATMKGDEVRKKYRLRCYSPQDQVVKLERKAKFGQDQAKTSLRLTRDQARAVMAGEYGFLPEMKSDAAQVFYTELCQGGYRPNLLLEYRRVAFTAPANHIRVTFDSGIRYTKSNLDLFDEAPGMVPLLHADQGILEVKYDAFLFSYIKDLLRGVDTLPTAFGKYVLACERAT